MVVINSIRNILKESSKRDSLFFDADNQAQTDVDNNKQSYANSHGTCSCPTCTIKVDAQKWQSGAQSMQCLVRVTDVEMSGCDYRNGYFLIDVYPGWFNSKPTAAIWDTSDQRRIRYTFSDVTDAIGVSICNTNIVTDNGDFDAGNYDVTVSWINSGGTPVGSVDCPSCSLDVTWSRTS